LHGKIDFADLVKKSIAGFVSFLPISSGGRMTSHKHDKGAVLVGREKRQFGFFNWVDNMNWPF